MTSKDNIAGVSTNQEMTGRYFENEMSRHFRYLRTWKPF